MATLGSTTSDAQRNIYRWYDERYSDDAFNIYSEEWEVRIDSWHQNTTVTNIEEAQNDLEMGNFFLSDPIAAFSLWSLLQVCYDLDTAVCRPPQELASWKTLPPFKYLSDADVKYQWKRSLKALRQHIKHPDENSEKSEGSWESRMYEILLAVERFEDSFAVLKENFGLNLTETPGKKKCAEWMMNRISEEMGMRFSLITNLLEIEEGEFTERDFDDFDDYSLPPGFTSRRPTYNSWPIFKDPETQYEEQIQNKRLVQKQDSKPPEPLSIPKRERRTRVSKHRQRFINFKNFFRKWQNRKDKETV